MVTANKLLLAVTVTANSHFLYDLADFMSNDTESATTKTTNDTTESLNVPSLETKSVMIA